MPGEIVSTGEREFDRAPGDEPDLLFKVRSVRSVAGRWRCKNEQSSVDIRPLGLGCGRRGLAEGGRADGWRTVQPRRSALIGGALSAPHSGMACGPWRLAGSGKTWRAPRPPPSWHRLLVYSQGVQTLLRPSLNPHSCHVPRSWQDAGVPMGNPRAPESRTQPLSLRYICVEAPDSLGRHSTLITSSSSSSSSPARSDFLRRYLEPP